MSSTVRAAEAEADVIIYLNVRVHYQMKDEKWF